MRVTLANARLSMTKVPHLVLFGLFCVVTVIQFDRLDRRALTWSLLATAGLGLLVELEEGASVTGNCRLTDVLPDITGAVIAGALLLGLHIVRSRWLARSPGG